MVGAVAACGSVAAATAGQRGGDHDSDHDNRRDAAADPQAAPVAAWLDRAAGPARRDRSHRSGRCAGAIPGLTVPARLPEAWLGVPGLPGSGRLRWLAAITAWLRRLTAVAAGRPTSAGRLAWLPVLAWLSELARLSGLPCSLPR